LVHEWAPAIGRRREDYGTQSLRRTRAIIYKTIGDLRSVRLLLVHTRIESTVRYRGIDVEDVVTLAAQSGLKAGWFGDEQTWAAPDPNSPFNAAPALPDRRH
jgi:hypothetical protein